MRRRALLASAGAVVAGAGCLGHPGWGGGTRVVGQEYERYAPRRDRQGNPTIVAFDGEDRTVHVTGFVYYGSSSCDEPKLERATYDEEDDRLTVVVGHGSKGPLPSFGACTADMAGTHYRASVRFAGGFPGTVEVTERSADERESDHRVVERAAQAERCTDARPFGRDDPRDAHWTCPEEYVAANVSVDADAGD